MVFTRAFPFLFIHSLWWNKKRSQQAHKTIFIEALDTAREGLLDFHPNRKVMKIEEKLKKTFTYMQIQYSRSAQNKLSFPLLQRKSVRLDN
jgi:hypothetical protein